MNDIIVETKQMKDAKLAYCDTCSAKLSGQKYIRVKVGSPPTTFRFCDGYCYDAEKIKKARGADR